MTDVKPLGIYIHIPFCKAKCKYCAFVSTPDLTLQKRYVAALVREIRHSEKKGCACDTVYIGGGTPSCLYRGAITDIMNAVRDTFEVEKFGEITVEANPESCTPDFVRECKAAGVNRASMGLQSCDDKVLRAIGRVHTFSDYLRAVDLLRDNFDNISSDIILGLPYQTCSDIDIAVDIITERCRHISVYALTVEEGTPLYDSGFASDDDNIADMYDRACSRLASRGFKRYEVSNFASDGGESRHNKKYWDCDAYCGFGVAAHGYDGESIRYSHSEDIADYIENTRTIKTVLSEKDRYNEYIMLRLRTEVGIVINDFKSRFGFDIRDRAAYELDCLTAEKAIVASAERIAIAPDKMFVMNGIIETLMMD